MNGESWVHPLETELDKIVSSLVDQTHRRTRGDILKGKIQFVNYA